MKKGIIILLIFCFTILLAPAVMAEDQNQEFIKARVVKILQEGENEKGGYIQPFQILQLELLSGEDSGKLITHEHGEIVSIEEAEKVRVGETVILSKLSNGRYFIIDSYRIPPVVIITLIFIAVIVIFAGIKGVGSFFGLCFSIGILIFFVVPKIISGSDPIIVSIIGATAITGVSIYLSHGFSKRTSLAVVSTLISLIIATVMAAIFVLLTNLLGMGTDTAYALQISGLESINLRGLLLGGIIIGALGVLDDVTTAQTATVHQLHLANSSLTIRELYRRGIDVGREHMASMVNTLALAYAGASLPLFILFTFQPQQPLWVTLNSEFIVEELVRTLVGSITLILAIPIATVIAAYYYGRK